MARGERVKNTPVGFVLANGCVLWRGSIRCDGYGRRTNNGTTERLSRRVLERKLGRVIHAGYMALHRCNNPTCVNPNHIYEGDNADNMRDRVDSGNHPVGVNTSGNKLINPEVLRIRSLLAKGVPVSVLAPIFGVTERLIYMIGRREIWKHL